MKRIDLDKFIKMEDGLQELRFAVSDMKQKRDFLKMDISNLAIDIKDAESLIKEIEQDKSHQYHIYQKLL
tara:strand:+ start:20 stop:229 length:210 start_codon:yes stop_codon:yes gene_type:complete